MKNTSILIITNKSEAGETISQKLKLLRECDTVRIVSYIEAISVLNTTQPSLIILYCANDDSVSIVKEIRNIKSLNQVPILFVMDNLVEEKLFFAFDNGIDDFFFLSDTDSVILMRIFLTLQKSVLYRKIETNNEILIAAGIIDKETGIYSKEQAPMALRNFFSKSIEENLENTVFMYVKPVSYNNKRLNMNKITDVIKSIPRGNDIVAFGKSSGFYIVLYNSGVAGARSVATRLRKSLIDNCEIYACAAEITTSFEEMEPLLYKTMKEQINEGIEFNYLFDLKEIEKLNIKDENGKTFKEFQKEFKRNFEKIVTPVFYHIQTTKSENLPNAKFTYSVEETESKFTIEENTLKSELIITYPTYIKIIIDVKHYNNNENPIVKRLVYDFEEFSEETLNLLLEEMVQDFSNTLNLNLMHDSEKQ